MLLQSNEGALNLLPALPDDWSTGNIKGIKGRGNFTVNMEWNNGKLLAAEIYSGSGGNCRLMTSVPVKVTGTIAKPISNSNRNSLNEKIEKPGYFKNEKAQLQELLLEKRYVIDFQTEKGKTYKITTR
ncbi:hypothetical protein D3C87_1602790 [compost metagenome]